MTLEMVTPLVGKQYSLMFYSPNVIRNGTPPVVMQYSFIFYSTDVNRNGNAPRRNAAFVFVLQHTCQQKW